MTTVAQASDLLPQARPAARRRLLLLGGTAEALAIASALAGRAELEVITSLAGRTRAPAQPEGTLRTGGFGGLNGLLDFLRRERIDLVIDATHPFAERISRHAAVAAWSAGLPLLRLERPPWQRQPDDIWYELSSLERAARILPKLGRRVFLTVGAGELAAFAALTELWFLVRLVEPPQTPPPLARHELILGRGPFSAAAELRLLEQHRIDVLVAKNSGGDATYGKIAAARALGLPVVLLRRPPPAAPSERAPETVASVEAALAWLAAQLCPR